MGLRDNVVKSLRTLFDAEREDRIAAESPSAQAMRQSPNSIYNVWGREDVGGLLSVSQNLQDRYADCEAMLDYPDIRTAIEYFASDATQPNMDNGRTIWVKSRDAAIVGSADSLIKRRLRLEDDVYSLAFSLCSSGNCLEEVLITDNGVVGLNHLPAPTMRRVERLEGTLIGYVQDVTGRFTAEQDELRKMVAGQTEVPPHVALFEDWQVVHFRLRTASRRSPYGVSVAEPARWIWKRLVMLEDAVMIYKLCLRGDSQIWTPSGRTAIKDLNEGDEVYSYTTAGTLKKTKVVYKKHNGQDQIFRVFSDHRELFANKTHPVLVETIEHNGSGNQITRRLDYVEVQNLKPGVHRLVTPKKNNDDWEEIKLKRPALHSKARLAGSAKRTVGLLKLQKSVGVQAHRIKAFFAGDYELKTDTAVALLEANDQSTDTLEVQEHWGGSRGRAVSGVSLPDVVDEDFARWWGFMLGDGFITTRTHKNGYEAQNEVGFAIGADAQVNETYRAIFERYAPVKLANNSGGRLGSYSFVSSKFVEFMLLNGFIPGCHEKRLPEWIYRAHPCFKLALIRGLADADAHITPSATSLVRRRKRFETARFELCNRPLLEDVRELAMQLGLVVTKIRSRQRHAHPINGRTVPSTTSYLMQVMFKPQEASEPLRGVEPALNDDIWDIGVEADEHNFVANGVTVHNTRAPQRYAFYVDTTDVPPAKREAWLQKQKRDLKKKPMVDPRTGRLDMRYNPLCLAADTRVPLLDGSTKNMVEMTKAFERGEEQWVYSVDLSRGGAFTPGKVIWAGKTRRDAQLVKVTLDNGESIKATPDHKFIRRSGEFVETGSLKPGDSLMPFRRRVSDKKAGDTLDGYELVYDPAAKRSFYTHRIVAETTLGKTKGDGLLTHHIDFDSLNNSPKNLQLMEWEAHQALHRAAGFNGGIAVTKARRADPALDQRMRAAAARNITAYNMSEEKRARTSEQNCARDSGQYIRRYNASKKHKADNAIRRAGRLAFWAVPENRASVSEKNKLVYSDEFVAAIRTLVAEEPDAGATRIATLANERGLIELLKKANPNKTKKIKNVHRKMLRLMACDLGFKSFADFKQLAPCDNHKVVSVEWLTEREDTYCITVDETHTFATSAGVFVKNSLDEDYVISTGEGRQHARVEVLAGADYQNIDDVGYFQRKLHGALKVPRAYLGQDAPVQGRAILSNEDVRAARVTLQVQKELRNGIERLIRVDQAARLYPNPWQTEFEVCMTVPSGIYELAAMEVKNARADFAGRVQPFVSMRWIREHVFKMSDEEIMAIEEQAKKESMQQTELQQKQQALMSAPPIPADPMGQASPNPADGGQPQAAPAAPPAPPVAPPSRTEAIRRYDMQQRLEEQRDKLSRANHQMLIDKMGALAENDKSLAAKLDQSVGLVNDLRGLALRNGNGRVSALPSAVGRRF